MLNKLAQKRAILVAQRDQQAANLNTTIGAIAIIDELIAEQLGEEAQAAQAARTEPKGNAEAETMTETQLMDGLRDEGLIADDSEAKAA